MVFSEVITHLTPYGMTVFQVADSSAPIYGIRLLSDSETPLRPETLYIGHIHQLPVITEKAEGVYHFILFGAPTELERRMPNPPSNILLAGDDANRHKIYTLLSDALEQQTRFSSAVNAMTTALFSGKGLQALLDTAYQALNNPLWLIGTDNQLIAQAPQYGHPSLIAVKWDAFLSEELAFLSQHNSNTRERLHADTYCQFPCGALGEDMIVYPIRVQGILMGRLCTLAHFGPFGEYDHAFLKHLSSLIKQELQRSNSLKPSHSNAQAFFLSELISSSTIGQKVLESRMKDIHFVPGKYLYVAVFRSADDKPNDMSSLAGQLHSAFPSSIFLAQDSECVALLSTNRQLLPNYDEQQEQELLNSRRMEESLQKHAILNRLCIGVSHAFHDIAQVRTHYLQAKKIVNVRDRPQGWGVIYFSQAAPMEVLHIVQQNDDLLIYCEPALLDLLRQDEERGTDLTVTLFLYIESLCNIAQAAEYLHIHKNTLHYRLEKIRQVLGTDLKSGETVYRLMMSFRILSALHLFTPPPEFSSAPLSIPPFP